MQLKIAYIKGNWLKPTEGEVEFDWTLKRAALWQCLRHGCVWHKDSCAVGMPSVVEKYFYAKIFWMSLPNKLESQSVCVCVFPSCMPQTSACVKSQWVERGMSRHLDKQTVQKSSGRQLDDNENSWE